MIINDDGAWWLWTVAAQPPGDKSAFNKRQVNSCTGCDRDNFATFGKIEIQLTDLLRAFARTTRARHV